MSPLGQLIKPFGTTDSITSLGKWHFGIEVFVIVVVIKPK